MRKPCFFLHSDLWKIQHFILTSVKNMEEEQEDKLSKHNPTVVYTGNKEKTGQRTRNCTLGWCISWVQSLRLAAQEP